MKILVAGMTASCQRTFNETDRLLYLRLAGEKDQAAAGTTHALPEPLIGSLFSYLLGTKLPGTGTNYLKQKLFFTAQTSYGEPLTAKVTITRLRPEKNLVNLETICTDSSGRLICTGEALVLTE